MFRILTISVAVIGLMVGALVWSGGTSEKRAEFTFINRGDIFTLDLNQMTYMQDFRMTYGFREGLYSPDPLTLKPIPAVAIDRDPKPTDNDRVWTFHLRPEAKWSNGDQVTAHDFVFSWRRMLEDAGEYTYLFHYIDQSEEYEKSCHEGAPLDWSTVGIETPDDMTLRVRLKNPVPYFLELMAFPPFYPRHEKSMRPFRNFSDNDVVHRLEAYLDAAGRANQASELQARIPGFVKRVGRPDLSQNGAGVQDFLAMAKGFDLQSADLPQVLEILASLAALKPFDGPDGNPALAQKLSGYAAHHYFPYTYSSAYTRPATAPGGTGVVTNGPFIFKRWDFKRRLILEKSPNYWDRDNVHCQSMEMIVNDSPLSQLLMYDSGAIDWLADVPADVAPELRDKGRTDLRASPAFGTAFLTFMCRDELPANAGGGKNPLADMRVRRSMAMAIDKQFIVRNITRMGELPARTYLPPDGTLPAFLWLPGPWDHSRGPDRPYGLADFRQLLQGPPTTNGPGLPYEVKEACRLLAEAGYPDGKGFPRLPILYNTESTSRSRIAQALKSQWKEILNIDIEIRPIEGKIYKVDVSKKNYVIGLAAWYGDYPDISTFTDKYKSDSLQNDSDWQNPTFDKLCDDAAKEGDVQKRTTLLSQAENLIDTEVPIVPLYYYVNVSLSRDNVKGVAPNPRQVTIFKGVSVK